MSSPSELGQALSIAASTKLPEAKPKGQGLIGDYSTPVKQAIRDDLSGVPAGEEYCATRSHE